MRWHKIKIRLSDKMFSRYIRYRDNWRCQKCKRKFPLHAQNLHCSHFKSRGAKSVRWDPENADAMCASCHDYWESHKTEYEAWKKDQLGEKAFNLLLVRWNATGSDDEFLARLYVKELIKELEAKRNIKVIY